MQKKAFSLIEVLTVVAIISTISSVIFPALAQRRKSKITNKPNLEQLAKGALIYGNDWDGRIVVLANGPERSLVNVSDNSLTRFGEKRTDHWPLLMLPYIKGRGLFQDPRRDDTFHIWDRPAHAKTDAGYEPYGATYRNQNRYPCFGMNYLFLSPLMFDESGEPNKTRAASHSFSEAKNPAATILFVTSMRGAIATNMADLVGVHDTVRGNFIVNAPGMGRLVSNPSFLLYNNGTNCSADWCGDTDASSTGPQRGTNHVYIEKVLKGNHVAFLDGHVKFMSDAQMAAGTNYLDARPNGERNILGAVITDKRKYLWDLDGDFYGLY